MPQLLGSGSLQPFSFFLGSVAAFYTLAPSSSHTDLLLILPEYLSHFCFQEICIYCYLSLDCCLTHLTPLPGLLFFPVPFFWEAFLFPRTRSGLLVIGFHNTLWHSLQLQLVTHFLSYFFNICFPPQTGVSMSVGTIICLIYKHVA